MSTTVILEAPAVAGVYQQNGEFFNTFVQPIVVQPFSRVRLVCASLPLSLGIEIVAGVNDTFTIDLGGAGAAVPTVITTAAGFYKPEALAAAVTAAIKTAFIGGLPVSAGGGIVLFVSLVMGYDGLHQRFYFCDEKQLAAPGALVPPAAGDLQAWTPWENVAIVFAAGFGNISGFGVGRIVLQNGLPTYATYSASSVRIFHVEIPELELRTWVGAQVGGQRSILDSVPIEENDSEGAVVYTPARPPIHQLDNQNDSILTRLTVRILSTNTAGSLETLPALAFSSVSPTTIIMTIEPPIGGRSAEESDRTFTNAARIPESQKARFLARSAAAGSGRRC